MDIAGRFRAIPTVSAEEVRAFLKVREIGGHTLLDVRQPEEYRKGHLPGAVLIPLGELPSRLAELDPAKPTIVYCRSGARSRAAAQVLLEAGFANAASLEGGILAWEGARAEGPLDAGMAHFSGTDRPEELVSLAWALEDGTERFYEGLLAAVTDLETHELFTSLVAAEIHHKKTLTDLAVALKPTEKRMAVEASLIADSLGHDTMEGGIAVSAALSWAGGKPVRDILEFGMALEVNAYDLYVRMAHRMERDDARRVFVTIAEEERRHLEKLASLLDVKL